MKLPEPYLYCDDECECIGPETFKFASVKDGWEPLYSESQVSATFEPVLKQALEALWTSATPKGEAAIKAIRKLLNEPQSTHTAR